MVFFRTSLDFLIKYRLHILSFFAGFGLCIVLFSTGDHKKEEVGGTSSVKTELRQNGFSFINPLLECEMEGQILNNEYIPFEEEAKNKIQKNIIDIKRAKEVSVYYRDLNNGPWFGINEGENFSPASLLKVPLLMAYLKKSETYPNLLEEKLIFGKDEINKNLKQNLKPKYSIQEGQEYTIEKLLWFMIVYSDNDAMRILLDNMDQESLDKIYLDLGMSVPDIRKPEDFMSVKQYASFFRILYNASYLNRANSEKALELLSNVEYKDGLVAGIPADMKIAHKFGEREIDISGAKTKQLHDCGIIYYPGNPYLLCVMTRGDSFGELSSTIRDVSDIIYGVVNDAKRR